MKDITEKIVDKVFKHVEGNDPLLDVHAFNVFMAIDGRRSIGTIAMEDHYEINELTAVIKQLVDKGAIEPVLINSILLDKDAFFNELEMRLSRIMGPVSSIVIQDSVSELGSDVPNFPMNNAHELINLISRSIPNRVEADAFIRSMNG